MRERNENHRRVGAVLSAAGASILVLAAIGCDNAVRVGPLNLDLPTAPGPAVITLGPSVTEGRSIRGVSGVSLLAVGQVQIQRGAMESLTITAPRDVMPLLTSDVVAGRLLLDRTSGSYQGQASDIRYDVNVRRLDEVLLPGVGAIYAWDVDSDRFRVEIDGIGEIAAVGRADRQELRIHGVGKYQAPNLPSRIAEVSIRGSGSAVLRVSERIEGHVDFPCVLEYWGDPVVEVTGGGTVRRLGP